MNCKLVGNFVQRLEVTLAPGEDFYAEKGSLIYFESGIEKEIGFNGSGLGRLIGAKISGESLFILRLYNNSSIQKKLVIGSKNGLLPIKIQGETLICNKGVYVASNNRVDITTKVSIKGLIGGMGLFLQKISGSSTVFLDTVDTPIQLQLNAGESIEVDENHIIALRNVNESQLSSNWSLGNLLGGEGLSMLKITGPGQVYLSPGKLIAETEG